MLDASTRIDVLNLLGDLKARGLGILFITHDLSLGNYISERTVILRRGQIVEMGPTPAVFGQPLHPYTRMLIASVPQLHVKWGRLEAGERAGTGWTPAATEPCRYHGELLAGGASASTAALAASGLVEIEDGHFNRVRLPERRRNVRGTAHHRS